MPIANSKTGNISKSIRHVKSQLLYAYCSSLYVCENYGIDGTSILLMSVLLGENHHEGCEICHLTHIVIFCLNYLVHYLCMMQSVNVCYLLFQSV